MRVPGASLLSGSTWFNFASGCYTITLGQALFEATGSVAAFTAVVVIEYIGPIVLGAVAGSVSDRVNASLLCMWSAAAAAVAVIAYLLFPGSVPAAAVALGIVINVVRPFYRAGIFAAGSRSLNPAELPRYNLRWTVSVQAGQIVGGAVAGVMLSVASAGAAFAAAAGAFALSALSMWVARGNVRPTPRAAADRSGWLDLLRDIAGKPRRLVSLLLIGTDFVTISAFTVALAPLVSQVFGSTIWLGILDGLFALGAIAVSMIGLGRWSADSYLRHVISVGYSIQIIGVLLLVAGVSWNAADAALVCTGALIVGAGVATSSSQQVTILQRTVDEGSVGKAGAMRQAVIGLVTALVLPLIGVALGVSLLWAYLVVVAVLMLGIGVNLGLSSREKTPVAVERLRRM